MRLLVTNLDPSRLRIEGFDSDKLAQLRSFLTYHDRSAEFQYHKFRKARWFLNKYGEEAFKEELDKRKAEIKRCILFEDPETGDLTTYSGLADHIKARFPEVEVVNHVKYPEGSALPWKHKPEFPARDFQGVSAERLIQQGHAAVEIATGIGKSRIIHEVVRQLGLKTVIMAPIGPIAIQLYRELVHLLGEKYVGFYGDGKKVSKKLVTVGIHASLTRIEPGTQAWDDLSAAEVFIVDESHMTPASSLEKVCMGLCKTAPYRFFFSATQIRGDGAELVLKGITGPIVYSMTFREGVEAGYLSRPRFRMVKVWSDEFRTADANDMTRHHLYYNPRVVKKAGDIATMAALAGHPVLILVQEVEQFTDLLPHLRHQVGFAHGGLTKDNRDRVPEQFWDSDPFDLVAQFNRGELPILVGTSCIATGVDIRPAKTVIYLMGQSSEIKVKQAVGRGTRRPPGKDDFYFFDFMPMLPEDREGGMSNPNRHAQERLGFYRELYGDDVKVVE